MNLKQQYLNLLDTYENEQDLQDFLEENTSFIPREFVQNHGIHELLVFRKLKLAENYTTDFFYLSKSSDDWNCVLIELEKPKSKFFKDGSNELHPNFLAGLDQIDRWRAWFSNSENKDYFTKQALSFIRRPMYENPCFMKYVLVTGRREEYQDSSQRRSMIRAKERDDFKIISFDSLMENFQNHPSLYLCVKKNEYMEIHSDELLSDSLFQWISPEHLRITDQLKSNLITTTEEALEEDQIVLPNSLKESLEEWKKIKTL